VSTSTSVPSVRGATWVTRTDVHVDRIASAWLIRRFIDPEARFKFVAAKGYCPAAGELRFDMFDAEYTHEGEACTFETLTKRFGLRVPALRIMGEIVHDIDYKEPKFGRPETAGVEGIIRGIAQHYEEDTARLSQGALVFEGLYDALAQGPSASPRALGLPSSKPKAARPKRKHR
jgi:hypothetical protein